MPKLAKIGVFISINRVSIMSLGGGWRLTSKMNTQAGISEIADYLVLYVQAYRERYRICTLPPPAGGGFPKVKISSYLDSPRLDVYVSDDGVVIADTNEITDEERVSNRPAVIAIDAPNIVPWEGEEQFFDWRLGARTPISQDVLNGSLGNPVDVTTRLIGESRLVVNRSDLPLTEVVSRLTLGGMGESVQIPYSDSTSPFWQPWILSNFWFVIRDRSVARFVRRLEAFCHLDAAAWDPRTIPIRVNCDVRRDFKYALGKPPGGAHVFYPEHSMVDDSVDRLSLLRQAINELASFLHTYSGDTEDRFHNLLESHPILLDVYGFVESKPRFTYPPGEGPLGKVYVEPDFVIRLPGGRYRLVEIERPSKSIATLQGHPKAELNQAAFQIAEWVDFMKHHYDQIRDTYPSIVSNYETALIISRTTEDNYGNRTKFVRYMDLLREHHRIDLVMTYDDLLQRASAALDRLESMTA